MTESDKQSSQNTYPRIVILTGAGLSSESGIDIYRGKTGLWEKYRLEDVATPEAYKQTPGKVHEFYNIRRSQLSDPKIKPNDAHKALARLDKELGQEVMIITQNVDDLLEKAGVRQVIHMHGELTKIRCENCANVQVWDKDLDVETICTQCGEAGFLRPHIVWFGEIPFGLEMIYTALANCETYISIGTSGSVYPAGGFVQEARKGKCNETVEINSEDTAISSFFDRRITGKAGDVVPGYIDELLERYSK